MKPSDLKSLFDTDEERSLEKNVKMWVSMIMTFFCSSETSTYILQQERSSILCDTVFLWFSFSFFLSHQWGSCYFDQKSSGWFSYLWEVKGLIMGIKHFQIAFEWLSLFLLSVNQSLRRRLLCSPGCNFLRIIHLFPLPPLAYYAFYTSFIFFQFFSFPTFLWFFLVVVPFKKIALVKKKCQDPPEADRHKCHGQGEHSDNLKGRIKPYWSVLQGYLLSLLYKLSFFS